MADVLSVEIVNNIRFDKYFRKWGKEDEKSRAKVGLQLINWIANGSPREARVPPILFGTLTGSGSVFLGSKLIGFLPKVDGMGTPADSYQEKDGIITIIFNTPYAARWHENKFTPGPRSQQRGGDVGYKYVERHLEADRFALIDFYAKLQRKNVK